MTLIVFSIFQYQGPSFQVLYLGFMDVVLQLYHAQTDNHTQKYYLSFLLTKFFIVTVTGPPGLCVR